MLKISGYAEKIEKIVPIKESLVDMEECLTHVYLEDFNQPLVFKGRLSQIVNIYVKVEEYIDFKAKYVDKKNIVVDSFSMLGKRKPKESY